MHWAASNQEEEDLALALAISASLTEGHAQQRTPDLQPRSPSAPPGRVPPPQRHAGAPSPLARPPPQQAQSHQRPPPPPPPAPQRQQQQQQQVEPVESNGCAGCGRGIFWGAPHVTALGRKWHSSCLRCSLCNDPLHGPNGVQFACGSDGKPYHMDCHKTKFHPICSICNNFVPSRPDGKIEFRELRFWREKHCAHHEANTVQCCSCSRFRPQNAPQWVSLSDNRDLCLECVSSIVVDTKDAQPLYDEILAFYRSMGMAHPHRAPMILVDSKTLHEYSDMEGKDSRTGGPIFHVRGLCLATVYRSIPSIIRSGGGHGLQVSSISTLLDRATTSCSVSAILVLYGLPRLLTGCILAHELMHAWLRMRNETGLDSQVEEGLCQLMAMLWLDMQHDKLNGDAMQQRLASYFAFQIREDTSKVYGDGFRIAYDEFQKQGGGMRGLAGVINNVLTTGRIS